VPDANLKILGERIRKTRKALGWSQERFADEADLDRAYAGRIERGEANITFTVLCKLCRALGRDVASLTEGLPQRTKR
jgi:transcriptional regulator with XRE-family HTH domain